MLEAIRKHAKGWLAKVILGVIAVTFALFGVDSYMKGNNNADVVAVVGPNKISRQEYTRELQNQADRLREALGEKFDRSVTESPEFRKKVLDSLVERKALLLNAQQQGFRPPDHYVENIVLQIPAFQVDGVFSPQRFEAMLRQRNMTPAGFEDEIRNGYLLEMQTSPIALGTFSANTALAQLTRILSQQREVSWVDMRPSDVSTQVSTSAADIQNYYATHRAAFTEPEKIRAEYLTLSIEAAMGDIAVSDNEINDFYQQNAAKLSQPEQRTASHVLIGVDKNADAATKARARAKAIALTAELQKTPARFGEVARKESQDPGSAAQNGSLGSFARGAMVKPFEDAVFEMKVGEIRGPVESEFGFHIIRLDGIQPATTMPLETVRSEITAQIRKQKAQKKFSEIAENFSNLVYEKADSLKPAADALKLTVQTTDWMSAKNAPAPFLNSKLGTLLFNADAIKSKQNTEAVEVTPGVLVAARVMDYRPAVVRTLNEVQPLIEQKLRAERLTKLLVDKGEDVMKQLRLGNESGLHWSDLKTVSRQSAEGLEGDLMAAIFRVDTKKLPAYTGLLNRDGSYRMVRVSRVLDNASLPPALTASVKNGIEQMLQRADLEAMVTLAKSAQKLEIREGALEVK